jgi:hypothetical protein
LIFVGSFGSKPERFLPVAQLLLAFFFASCETQLRFCCGVAIVKTAGTRDCSHPARLKQTVHSFCVA